MKDVLTRTPVLWGALFATLLMTGLFPVAAGHWGLTYLDGISDPELARQAMTSMSADQRTTHAWLTATLDVAYPLAYGALFVGSALAFFKNRAGVYLAAAIAIVVPTDVLEGVVQVLALVDIVDWLDAKALLTPLKFALFMLGAGVMVVGWVVWLLRRLSARGA